jgi:hypothetical protein
MKYLALSLILLASCSVSKRANWHIKRAIKLDPTIVTSKVDTIIKTVSDSGKVYFYGDTTVDNDILFINVSHKGEVTELYWFLKPTEIKIPVKETTIIPNKPRYQVRQEERTNRRLIKYKEKVVLKYIKQKSKSERKKSFKSYIYVFIAGAITSLVFKGLVKTYLFK